MPHPEPDEMPLDGENRKIQILRERARALACKPQSQGPIGGGLEVIEFRLAEERYALEAAYVSAVCPLEDLTPLPCTPRFVRGLVNIRGRILPVIDVKQFFDLPDHGITDLHRILLVETAETAFGILADTIVGVRMIAEETIQSSLPTLTGIRAEYLKGVTAERVVILNIARILADRRIIVDQKVEA